MPSNPPVDFEERAKRPRGTTSADYPYAIKARDLQQNFVYATLAIDETLVEEQPGPGGHNQRRLKIPSVPQSGIFVLAAVNGEPVWLATQDC